MAFLLLCCVTICLCLDRAGRQLIYNLSQKHRNSLVLNYAIQRILQAGHEEEVANVGSSLASYFSVFHRLLTNRLKQVPQADAAALQHLTAELKVGPSNQAFPLTSALEQIPIMSLLCRVSHLMYAGITNLLPSVCHLLHPESASSSTCL